MWLLKPLENWFWGQEAVEVPEEKDSQGCTLPFSLPLEVWHEILKRLEDTEVLQLSTVNYSVSPPPTLTLLAAFLSLVRQDALWQIRFASRRKCSVPKSEVLKKVGPKDFSVK
jgi:hypothetical protein